MLHQQPGLAPYRLPSGGGSWARSRGGVSALPHVAMTAIVPYCRIEHNPERPKNANPEEGGHAQQGRGHARVCRLIADGDKSA